MTARPAAERDAALDVYRGLAIVAVVLLHMSGMALRFASAGSTLQDGIILLNRALQFAVPAFLFLTAAALTGSALKKFALGRYYRGRVQKIVLPYLIWTALYALFRVYTGANSRGDLLDPAQWRFWVQYGKGYFHLYYLLVALQFYLVLPLLLPLWRRRWPLWSVLTAALALQLGVYELNRAALHFRFPGTMALWYIPALAAGMWVGSLSSAGGRSFENVWRRAAPALIALTLLGLAWYLPQGHALLTQNLSSPAWRGTFAYSAAHWWYTTFACLTLLGVSRALARGARSVSAPLTGLGNASLQIYLIHPALLFFFERQGFPGTLPAFALTFAAYTALALLIPYGIARALEGRAASGWLFGR